MIDLNIFADLEASTAEELVKSLTLVAIILMMFEATVLLAYYKDIIFAIITLLNYIGIYIESKNKPDLEYFLKTLISFISIISVFIFVTFLHDFDKVFYRQYSKFYNKYRQNRIVMLNTPKNKKNKKQSNFEMDQRNGRS